jgi:hypothetical protein
MRATLAATAAILLLCAGVAFAAGEVRQSGTSSQGRPVALVARTDVLARYVITWRAKCPGTTYTGSSDLRRIPLRPDGSFRATLRYSHGVGRGRRAHVSVTLSGSLNGAATRASGVFGGSARIDRLGMCRSGRITWKTRKNTD